jgi:hypothetical protein
MGAFEWKRAECINAFFHLKKAKVDRVFMRLGGEKRGRGE